MQAPEKSHLVGEKVINKVCELPDDVTKNEPVPGELYRQQRVWRKQADTIGDDAKGNKLSNNAIEYINEEWNLVFSPAKILMRKCQQELDDDNEWNKGRKDGLNSLPGAKRIIIAGPNDFDESLHRKEAGDLAP